MCSAAASGGYAAAEAQPDAHRASHPSDCAVPPRDPSEPTGPMAWTQASLSRGLARAGPPRARRRRTRRAVARTIARGTVSAPSVHRSSGDTGSECFPWVDIQELTGPGALWDSLSNQPPVVDPTEQWIAYGVVFDVDRDGVPDWRYGIDNMPVDATGERPHRAWVTDLHTGRTESAAGPPYGGVVGDSFYLGLGHTGAAFNMTASGRPGQCPDVRCPGRATDVRFYAWASVIQDGRVVATDYAPDARVAGPDHPGAGQNEESPFGIGRGHTMCDLPRQPRLSRNGQGRAIGITFTLPDGWAWNDPDQPVDVHGKHAHSRDGLIKPATGMAAPQGMRLQFLRGGWLLSDPCRTSDAAPDIKVGPTAGEFADALAAHPLLDVTTPVPVTLGGHRGKYVDLQVPSDIAACTKGYHPWAPAYYAPGPNQRWHIWSLDVDGVRVVILSEDFAGTSAQDVAEMRAIIESIEINP